MKSGTVGFRTRGVSLVLSVKYLVQHSKETSLRSLPKSKETSNFRFQERHWTFRDILTRKGEGLAWRTRRRAEWDTIGKTRERKDVHVFAPSGVSEGWVTWEGNLVKGVRDVSNEGTEEARKRISSGRLTSKRLVRETTYGEGTRDTVRDGRKERNRGIVNQRWAVRIRKLKQTNKLCPLYRSCVHNSHVKQTKQV